MLIEYVLSEGAHLFLYDVWLLLCSSATVAELSSYSSEWSQALKYLLSDLL